MNKCPTHIDEAINKTSKKFFEYLSSRENAPLIMILKTHLLCEELIFKFLQSAATNKQYLASARLTFNQAMHIARALSKKGESCWTWDALIQLNSLRNSMSHNLEPPALKEKFVNFVKHVLTHIDYAHDIVEEMHNKKQNVFPLVLLAVYSQLAYTLGIDPITFMTNKINESDIMNTDKS